jgi:hypothetical protein
MRWWDEDAVSIALLALCEAVEAGVPDEHIDNAVRRDLLNHIRREEIRKTSRIGAEPAAEPEPANLDEALAVLSEEEREIFTLRYVKNETVAGIVRCRGMHVRKVYRILARCRTLVRDNLGWTLPASSTSATASTTPRR